MRKRYVSAAAGHRDAFAGRIGIAWLLVSTHDVDLPTNMPEPAPNGCFAPRRTRNGWAVKRVELLPLVRTARTGVPGGFFEHGLGVE